MCIAALLNTCNRVCSRHRPEFSKLHPDSGLWRRIRHHLKLTDNSKIPHAKTDLRYAAAVAAVGFAFLLRWWFGAAFDNVPAFILFYPTVLVVTSIAGSGPGLLAILLSTVVVNCFSMEPRGSLAVSWPTNLLESVVFAGTTGFVCVFLHRLQRSRAEESISQRSEQRFRMTVDASNQLAWTARADEIHQRLATIVEFSDDAILSKRLDGTILTWNAGAERLFGYRAEEIIGRRILQMVPADRVEEDDSIVARLRRGENCDHIETVRVAKDGRRIDVSVTISPLKDREGNVVGASKIARDITGRKRAEAELKMAVQTAETAKIAAEAANKTKDRFIAILSHELRTPLNPVLISASTLVKDPRLDDDVREELEMICRNVELETRLIDDLLDMTRVELGKVELDRRQVELGATLRRVIETCNPDILAKNIDVVMDYSEPVFWVDADGARLQQILWNVIKNAIKFSPANSVIKIFVLRDHEGFALVRVIDSGIGIDSAQLGHIFNAFNHGSDAVNRRFGGVGLGLAIAKSLVELHGGTISVLSDGEGKGATFDVRLPMALHQPIPAKETRRLTPGTAEVPLPERPLRILLIEDHADTAKIMARMLRKQGHAVDHALDVATSLKLLKEKEFDLLVSDLGLPDGNGWDIMRDLRGSGSNLPGIALSGYGQDADIQNSLDAGYCAHFTKPFNIGTLLAKIQEVGQHRMLNAAGAN